MTRYYFSWREAGQEVVDDVGIECPDIPSAKAQAERALAERAIDAALDDEHPEITIEVTDQDHNRVLQAVLTLRTRAITFIEEKTHG